MNDHYATLGIPATADEAAIKSAYRRLAKEYHPDTNKAPGAEAKFKEINEAHDVLKNPQSKSAYDAQRMGGGSRERNFSWTDRNYSTGFSGGGANIDIEELLRDIRNARTHFPEDAKNRDIVLKYGITLEEAFAGKEATAKYNLPGKETQNITFKINPGIQDGMKLRFQGKGDHSMSNVPAGDLYIQIQIMPHHNFIRMGYDLVTSTTIDYLDAMLGTEREIPTIEGKLIKMRVPAGIMPGQSLRAAGKGMPQANGTRGNMMVEITFKPEKLSETTRLALEEIRRQKNA